MPLQLVSFVETAEPTARRKTGLLLGDRVAGLARLVQAFPEGVPGGSRSGHYEHSAMDYVLNPPLLRDARNLAAWLAGRRESEQLELTLPLEAVRLLCPMFHPPKLFCLAQNFPSHAAESSRHITHSGESDADRMTPHVFMKPSSNTVRGPGDPIVIARNAQFIDYEAEVAVIIGKPGKYIPASEALSHVAAVTAMNDVSERDLLIWERTQEREWDHFFDWLNGKWLDGFAPMGPCVVPAEDLDINDLEIRCFVNGELRQQGNTSEMFHSVAQTIEYISQILTLETGDVIAMGTPGGVGKAMGKRLQPGDVVTVEVSGVGTLTNPVVAEE